MKDAIASIIVWMLVAVTAPIWLPIMLILLIIDKRRLRYEEL